MEKKLLITAKEVMNELGVSRSYAYNLIQKMNNELSQKGYIVISGKVSRKYFEEQFYGMSDAHKKGVNNSDGSIQGKKR